MDIAIDIFQSALIFINSQFLRQIEQKTMTRLLKKKVGHSV